MKSQTMSKTPTTHTPSSSKTTPIWSSRINKLAMPKGQKIGQIIRRISTDRLICYSIILFRSRRCCRGGSFFVNDQRYFTFLYSSPRAIQICGHHQGELRMRTGIFKDYFLSFLLYFPIFPLGQMSDREFAAYKERMAEKVELHASTPNNATRGTDDSNGQNQRQFMDNNPFEL